jgi:hypothetical protein
MTGKYDRKGEWAQAGSPRVGRKLPARHVANPSNDRTG